MRADIRNLQELRDAVSEAIEKRETLVMVFHTPGAQVYRFLINQHAIERQECVKTGEARP